MILLLLKESSDAENLPEEQKAIFNTVFESHGMKAIDFLHLISHANRHEVKKGEKLVTLGAKHHHLHFVQSGRLSVQRPGESMPEIHEHQFVGAMSFMTWEGNLAAHQRMRHAKIEHFNQWNSDSPFNFVFTSFIGGSETKGNSTTLKLQKTSNSSSSASGNSTMKVTNCSNTGSVAANDEENDDDYNEYKDDIEEEEEVEKVEEEGLADVTCEVDCVVYSWEFRELRELLISSPNLGLVFERCISADLNLKMSNNWSRDHLRRYEQLVRWTLEASLEKIPSSSMKESSTNTNNSIDDIKKQLAQATITDKDRLLLSMYRSEYAVTDKEHELALIDLGWTTEEFHKGKKY